MSCIRVFLTTVLLVAISASRAMAADAASSEKEIAAIRAAANAYVSALEQGKAETLICRVDAGRRLCRCRGPLVQGPRHDRERNSAKGSAPNAAIRK